jgi:hypothetical protein
MAAADEPRHSGRHDEDVGGHGVFVQQPGLEAVHVTGGREGLGLPRVLWQLFAGVVAAERAGDLADSSFVGTRGVIVADEQGSQPGSPAGRGQVGGFDGDLAP